MLVWLNFFLFASHQVLLFVSIPLPNTNYQSLIDCLGIMGSYLIMCMWQVETLPMNHSLHRLYLHLDFWLSGCFPSLNTPIRSAICMLTPVLECNFYFLRVYSCSQVSQHHLAIKCVTNLSIFGSHLSPTWDNPTHLCLCPCHHLSPLLHLSSQTLWWMCHLNHPKSFDTSVFGMSVLGFFRSLWKYTGPWLVWTFVGTVVIASLWIVLTKDPGSVFLFSWPHFTLIICKDYPSLCLW